MSCQSLNPGSNGMYALRIFAPQLATDIGLNPLSLIGFCGICSMLTLSNQVKSMIAFLILVFNGICCA